MKNLDKEIWKPIIGYEGLYEISNYGRVKSFTRKNTIILKAACNSSGYPQVMFSVKDKGNKTIAVHRLVAQAFCKGYSPDLHVNHIDGDKLNNHYSNLEWCTFTENMRHAYATGLKTGHLHKDNPRSRSVVQLSKEGDYIKDYEIINDVKESGFNPGNVSQCCRGEKKTHKGFRWMYKEDYETKEEIV